MKLYFNVAKSKSYGLADNALFYGNYKKVIQIAEILNKKRGVLQNPEIALTPSELYIFTIFPKIFRDVIKLFEQKEKLSIEDIITLELHEFPKEERKLFFDKFNENFTVSDEDFHYYLLSLKLINENPALRKIADLIDDSNLKRETIYQKLFSKIEKKLSKVKPNYLKNNSLTDFLRLPYIENPDDIYKQLLFIIDNWRELLGDDLQFLLKAVDYYKEDTKFGLPIPGPAKVYNFNELEPEKFTEDKDWMPHLILMAKSTYVWLYQLSVKYKKRISRLDQIPDEELELLHKRGFTGLWLIGIWERSKASQRIKQLTGQHNAIASAYSLDDYKIAEDLGGEEAFESLKERAQRYNIRLACDMVPNHTGIDSKWIVEHPDYFMQLDYSPYPNYTFNGENLSFKPDVKVYLEDHYYDKTDAAVVFKLIDKANRTRYIYHGNDGTSFPWNDTAQLDYTKEVVRKAVSDKIIEVAKKFPIIRFDAAMTLAKKHFQRLWFPQPGTGGAIPSRAQFGMTKEEFDKIMPKEFWREVVDRVNAEVPDTLLLAEAFWMMEGYFVRTLGMHRVYNSAFMNMLKDEDNAKYRKSIFNILEFNPQILKRFVNFMSNPDEETAINQFGDNDKYFGVCILMVTMPGLPMFAHGQIEGFRERYGMEFYKPAWDEIENKYLIERHNREIFPLLKIRRFFSDVENFYLYNFNVSPDNVNEDVFVYSNEYQGNKTLVVYHNRYANTSGRVLYADYPIKTKSGVIWQKRKLAENFKLTNDRNHYVIFKDLINGTEYIRNSNEIWEYGLFFNLRAYQYMVLGDFREVEDNKEKEFDKIAVYLQGGGTKDIYHLKDKIKYLAQIDAFNAYINKNNIDMIITLSKVATGEYKLFLSDYLKPAIDNFIDAVGEDKNLTEKILEDIETLITKSKNIILPFKDENQSAIRLAILYYMIMEFKLESLEKFYLFEEIASIFNDDELSLIKGLKAISQNKIKDEKILFEEIFNNTNIAKYLQLNLFDNHFWFAKERFETFLNILFIQATLENKDWDFNKISKVYLNSQYKVDEFLKGL